MSQTRPVQYLCVSAPDKIALIDFLGKFAVQVKLTLEDEELRVEVTGCDDRGTILEDKCYEVPEADDRH